MPALVLLNIRMPRMDGFEVLRWIRQQPRLVDLPVVMLTGSNAKTGEEAAQRFGAPLFVKPVDFSNATELSGSIQRLIGTPN